MQQVEVLVGERLTVNGLTTGTITVREITTLTHELRNDTVERGTLVVQRLAELADALLTRTQRSKVLGSLGRHVAKEFKLDATRRGVANRHVHEDVRPLASHVTGARSTAVLPARSRSRRIL